jgi:hypothetical protein
VLDGSGKEDTIEPSGEIEAESCASNDVGRNESIPFLESKAKEAKRGQLNLNMNKIGFKQECEDYIQKICIVGTSALDLLSWTHIYDTYIIYS